MKTHNFKLILDREPDDDEFDRLYAVFDDGAIATVAGRAEVTFHRDAPTLDRAVATAVNEVRSVGFSPVRVELDSARPTAFA